MFSNKKMNKHDASKIPTYIIGGSKQTVVYRMAQAK